jgi:predicted amino acid-binding ACT domain protein
MGVLVRMRIALADRPGSLARMATIVAEHGGNITSIDVHRCGVVTAMNEMVVEFPLRHDLSALRNELTASGVATLLSHEEGEATDPVIEATRRAGDMLDALGEDPDAVLCRTVGDLCATPVVWVCPTADAVRWEAGRFARERGGPIALWTSTLPEHLAGQLPDEVWLLAVPGPGTVVGGRMVFVAREAEFTATEIARIEALMQLNDRVVRRIPRPAPSTRV